MIWLLVKVDLCCTKQVDKFSGLVFAFKRSKLPFKWYSFEEGNLINHRLICHIFQKPGITVIVRASKYNMSTMTIV